MKHSVTKTGNVCYRCLDDIDQIPAHEFVYCKEKSCRSLLCQQHDDKLCVVHLYETLKKSDKIIYGIIRMENIIQFFAQGIETQTFDINDVVGVEFSQEDSVFTICLENKKKILLLVKSKDIQYIKSKWDQHWGVVMDKSCPTTVCFFHMDKDD